MHITLRQISYFLAAAETGSISAAAVRMGISQSAVTESIRTLEDQAGVHLFERNSKGVELTYQGHQMMRHVVKSELPAIAVALHELATNAAKYGALSATEGHIDIKWSHTDGWLILFWIETGGPPVKTPTRQGFGGKVIKNMIEQLKGRTRFDWRPEGLVCEITLQA